MGGTPRTNVANGTKGFLALLLALSMTLVASTGAVSAEQAQESLEKDEAIMVALEEADFYRHADMREAGEWILDEELKESDLESLLSDDDDDVEQRDGNVSQVVVIVWTDGELAWITVVVIYEDGTIDINRYGPMEVSDLRERLANFDGRIIVNWIRNDAPDVRPCPHGTLHGHIGVDAAGNSVFFGQIMDSSGVQIGTLSGTFVNGAFAGTYALLNGPNGQLSGQYGQGMFNGTWADANSAADGLLKGYYDFNSTSSKGVFKGKWKMLCDDDDERPGDDLVRPKPKPLEVKPTEIGEADEDKPSIERMKKNTAELLDKELVETEGGYSVDVGDAATGSALTAVPMLGLGLLRRRFLGL